MLGTSYSKRNQARHIFSPSWQTAYCTVHWSRDDLKEIVVEMFPVEYRVKICARRQCIKLI